MTRALLAGELDLRGVGRLRAVPQRRQHLAGLAVVVIDRLLAEDHQQRLLALDELQQRARGDQRLDDAVGLHVQRAVRAHRQRGAQLLLAVGGPDGGDDDFVGAAALLDAQRLLERDLVEGVDAHLHPVGDDAAAVGLDPDAHVVIHHALDADQDAFHAVVRRFRNACARLTGRGGQYSGSAARCCRDVPRR